jgi:hypothetical protein
MPARVRPSWRGTAPDVATARPTASAALGTERTVEMVGTVEDIGPFWRIDPGIVNAALPVGLVPGLRTDAC